MKYSKIRHEVVIDFVELEIKTSASTQALHICKFLNNDAIPFVAGCDANTGIEFAKNYTNTTTTLFRFHIHNPTSARDVQKLHSKLVGKYTLQYEPIATAIEIAFDTYSEGASVQELAEIETDRFIFLTYGISDEKKEAWHFYREPCDVPYSVAGMTRRDIVQRFAEGWQLTNINDKSSTLRYHLYVKMHDGPTDAEGKKKELPPEQHRARIEVTLRGDNLPCRNLVDLYLFDFTKLAQHFKFRRLDDTLHPCVRYALARGIGVQLGARGRYGRPVAGAAHTHPYATFRRSTQADDALNRAAFEGLRTLSREWPKNEVVRILRKKSLKKEAPRPPEPLPAIETMKSTGAPLIMSLGSTPNNEESITIKDNTDEQRESTNLFNKLSENPLQQLAFKSV